MNSARRHDIVTEVEGRGFVSSIEIANNWAVSLMTVRRDIQELANAGLVLKIRGGVGRLPSAIPAVPMKVISSSQLAMARRAAALASAEVTIGIVAGPYSECLARELARVECGTFITNSLDVAEILFSSSSSYSPIPQVVLLPGILGEGKSVTGPPCAEALRGICIDVSFVDVGGFDATAASFSDEFAAVDVIRAFARSSRRTVGLAHAARWNSRAPAAIDPSLLETIITDARPRDADMIAIARAGAELVMV